MNSTNDNVVNPNVTGTASNMRWSKGQTITGCVSGAATTTPIGVSGTVNSTTSIGTGSGATWVNTPTITTTGTAWPYTYTWPNYVYATNPKELQELKEDVEDLKDVVQDLASEIRLMRKELKRARKERD